MPPLATAGTFLLLLSFFAFLHCWLNAFAEMLRFADRTFYKVSWGRVGRALWGQPCRHPP